MILIRSNKREIIFCISFQRTGTTSTGSFFKNQGYKVADWNTSARNEWGGSYFEGNYKKIFNSKDFKNSKVFEDGPWFANSFFKFLFHYFPNSKFILLERDENKWFDSMKSHSQGKTLGNSHRHSVLYNREEDFYALNNVEDFLYTNAIDNLLPLTEKHRLHYIRIYRNRNREVKNFFKTFGSQRLFSSQLEDSAVWHRMGKFFDIDLPSDYNVHSNKS